MRPSVATSISSIQTSSSGPGMPSGQLLRSVPSAIVTFVIVSSRTST